MDAFKEEESVAKNGLGPTFNLDSCKSCHIHPQLGGSSPPNNPQYEYWGKNLKNTNKLPSFVEPKGPAREARFKRKPDGSPDGGVHDLFTIAGLPDSGKCNPPQPDFERELKKRNVIFRIPTPTFGAGLIELISDQEILDSHREKNSIQAQYGIRSKFNIIKAGHTSATRVNQNGNDGTIARFGWKAQNKSLLVFAGEAYNVEMGVTNELFPTERYEGSDCQSPIGTPNDTTNADKSGFDILSDVEKFATFMRFLAPPVPSNDVAGATPGSIVSGATIFEQVGCSACHTRKLRTGYSQKLPALSQKDVYLYSDLALHDMGRGLEDGISQGQATGREFRTAPLWGLGQRLYFLHDGRAIDLLHAIREHKSPGSEANKVVRKYDRLSNDHKQDLLNFLRSL